MTDAKQQHWVPNFYLKKFATQATIRTKNPKVFLIDKQGHFDGPRLMSTKEILRQNYLNSPVSKNGERDFSLEKHFEKIEAQAASYWDDLVKGQFSFDDPEARRTLSTFIAALHLRNKSLNDLYREGLRLSSLLFGPPARTAEDGTRVPLKPFEKCPDPTDGGRLFAQSTKRDIPRICDYFASCSWVFAFFEDELITSDRPVTFCTPGPRPGGPGLKGADSLLSLGPRSALLMFSNHDCPAGATRIASRRNHSGALNELIYRKADRFVISRSIDPNLGRKVQN